MSVGKSCLDDDVAALDIAEADIFRPGWYVSNVPILEVPPEQE
jgi:hypothetical protein